MDDSPNVPTMAPKPATYGELQGSHSAGMTYADLERTAATYADSPLEYTGEAN